MVVHNFYLLWLFYGFIYFHWFVILCSYFSLFIILVDDPKLEQFRTAEPIVTEPLPEPTGNYSLCSVWFFMNVDFYVWHSIQQYNTFYFQTRCVVKFEYFLLYYYF